MAISAWVKKLGRALKTDGEIEPQEIEITCFDNSKRFLILGGRVAGHSLLVSFFDITARKRMEEEKRILRERSFDSQKL